MVKYKNWTSSSKPEFLGTLQINVMYFKDDKGNDWYDVWEKLNNTDSWVIAINSDDSVCWIDKEIKGKYSPPIGGYIFTLKELPYDIQELRNGVWFYKNNKFVKYEIEKRPQRTKEDILNDLLALQEELKDL